MDKVYDKCCGIDVHKSSSSPALEKTEAGVTELWCNNQRAS